VVSRSKKIFGLIKKELSGVELCNDMLVVLPTEHIVRGFLIEATIEKDRIYLWRVVTPLHRPMRHVILNYSNRIFPESGEDIYIDENAYADSAERIRALVSKHMGYVRSIRRPRDFLRHIDWMMGNDSDHFRFDLALTYFRIGNVRNCREILRSLKTKVDKKELERPKKCHLKNPFDEDIKQAASAAECNPEKLAALLDRWENDNIERLGLRTSRGPANAPH
jgi:hypothetical protein